MLGAMAETPEHEETEEVVLRELSDEELDEIAGGDCAAATHGLPGQI